MGYRGYVEKQEQARVLRAQSWKLMDIARELGVAKSSVSLWVRDVEFVPLPVRHSAHRRPSSLHTKKLQEIEECNQWGTEVIGKMSDEAFFAAGVALYAGEGSKNDGSVGFANTDPTMIAFFCNWLRHFFDVDESRMRGSIYLHEGLDIDAAQNHWSEVMEIPAEQFRKPYRAVPDSSIRSRKHEFGCGYVTYSCSKTHRQIMGAIRALLSQ